MHAMAVNTGGDIRVSLTDQGLTVHAFGIDCVNLRVTTFAGLGNLGARLIRVGDVMGTMAVGADCGFLVASG